MKSKQEIKIEGVDRCCASRRYRRVQVVGDIRTQLHINVYNNYVSCKVVFTVYVIKNGYITHS